MAYDRQFSYVLYLPLARDCEFQSWGEEWTSDEKFSIIIHATYSKFCRTIYLNTQPLRPTNAARPSPQKGYELATDESDPQSSAPRRK